MQRDVRVRHLDGIRGLGILLVLAQHWAGQRHGIGGGYVGLDLFLVLSGYLITITATRSSAGYVSFLRRRARRLYPPLLVAVVVGVALCAVLPFSTVSVAGAALSGLTALLGLSSPAAALGLDLRPFTVTWSLSVEWYFYLLWPLLVLVARRRAVPPRRMVTWCLVGAAALFLASLPLSASWFYFGPTARVAELLVGAALAYRTLSSTPDVAPASRRSRATRVIGAVADVLAGAVVAALVAWLLLGPDQESWWTRVVGLPLAVGAAALFIVVGETRPRSLAIRLLGCRPLAGLGAVSYTVYLYHPLPLVLVNERTTGLPYGVVLAVFLGATAVLTAAAHVVVERPATRWSGSAGRRAVADVERAVSEGGSVTDPGAGSGRASSPGRRTPGRPDAARRG